MTAGLFGTGHHWYWTGQRVVSMALPATFSAMEVVPLILPLFVFSRIFSKAGYSGLLSLLLYIPLVNVIVLVYFAYTEWPIEKQLKERKQ